MTGESTMPGGIGRRQFLKLGAAATLAVASEQHLLFAAEPDQKFRIGMAATTWLSASPSVATYWKATQAIAALNIGATEADNSKTDFDSVYGKKLDEFREKSRTVGVRLEGVYQALPLHDPAQLPAMKAKIRSLSAFLKAGGAAYIALGWEVPWGPGSKIYQRTQADVQQTIRTADEIGRISLEEHGIPLALHAERDIPKEMTLQILDGTNPKYLKFCADVGHLTGMGLDALDTVKKYSSRLVASHWKDFDPKIGDPAYAKHGFHGDFVELGKGVVDFHGLADFYRQIGFDGWVQLELDRTREASIAISAQKMKAFVTDQLKLQMVPVSH
jgi:sugar phosphate isomerase/epimerase